MPRVAQKSLDITLVEFCHFVEVETSECSPEVLALSEDCDPRKDRTGIPQDKSSRTNGGSSVTGKPHFLIVVSNVLGIIAGPPAANNPVGAGLKEFAHEI